MAMSKAELQKAFREAAAMEFQEIPLDDTEIQYEFSAAFEQKMDRLLKKEKKFTWRLVNTASKRVAAIAVILLMFLTTACSVPAIREPIIEFIKETFDINIRYHYDNNAPDIIATEYHLSFVPSGFSETKADIDDGYIRIDYEDESGHRLYFVQNTGTTILNIDAEHTEYKTLDLDGREVQLYHYADTGENIFMAVWIEDGYFFKVFCNGEISEETMIEIVSGVKPTE